MKDRLSSEVSPRGGEDGSFAGRGIGCALAASDGVPSEIVGYTIHGRDARATARVVRARLMGGLPVPVRWARTGRMPVIRGRRRSVEGAHVDQEVFALEELGDGADVVEA